MDLQGKLAVVTGGARRLGREMVLSLAEAGARPVIHYHRSREQALALAAQTGGVALQADLASPQGAEGLARQVLALEGALSVWVNSASRLRPAAFLEADDALWQQTLQLNLLSPASCARLTAARFSDGGVIVNILDTAARQVWPGHAHHCVAKAGLQMLTRALAVELGPRLRVCGLIPGLLLPAVDMDSGLQERLIQRTPLRRPGDPADLCAALRFCIDSPYLTGSVITIDGGLLTAAPCPGP